MNIIQDDFIIAQDLLYKSCQLQYTNPIPDNENITYGACSFKVNSIEAIFRVAKITPKKIGQFVTLWKRINDGPIQPYDFIDKFEYIVISTRKDNNLGQFIFPKSALLKHGIISSNSSSGKLAIRIYPPWDIALNNQAKKTQIWQSQYFLELSNNKPIDCARAKLLYKINNV